MLFSAARWSGAALALLLPLTTFAQPGSAATDSSATTRPLAPALPLKPGNVIKIAPLGWVHGHLPFTVESRIAYERRIGRRSSLMGSYSYLGTNYPFSFLGAFALSAYLSGAVTLTGHPYVTWVDMKIRASGYRWQAQYRQYLTKRRVAPEGWYLAPHTSFATAEYTIDVGELGRVAGVRVRNRNFNLLFGHQRVFGKHFTFDVFTGLGYRDYRVAYGNGRGTWEPERRNKAHLKLSNGLNLGWAF